MNLPIDLPPLKGFRYPREIIALAVWAYHRLALSTADVEDLLAARGVIVSREAIRLWVNRFGSHFADCIRRERPRPNDKWHMDEVVITIRGKKHWLWRAIDADGDVLDILVQTRRNAKAAKRFFQRLVSQFGEPRVVITDKLRSYIKPVKTQAPNADHRAHKGLNNAIEVSHRPTRKREKIMGRFKSHRQAQRFLSAHDQINLIFRPRRYQLTATSYRHARNDAFSLWADYTAEMTA
ncbi:IS6 family transposase [Roseobacter sp. GAI101]|uniref:IS6 family transposase n=2 Tax=Roseobacter sp. (strain GAI101) TaxID=391589 RepID=UPI0001872176|nr:IS6 family transposase [Roseobacter sp. GAI101]EEB82359.1 transposase [Roseobacter sp. GAI101]EEB82433.1 transposase [Roseobacter sp. GAI101]